METLHRILGEDLGKIEELTKEIRDYVKPLSISLTPKIQINEVLESCLLFVSSNPSYHHIMIERKFNPNIPMIHMDRQKLMQAIFNGLLFLLKDSGNVAETLTLETKWDAPVPGKNWLQVDVGWKSKLPASNLRLVAVDGWGIDETSEDLDDPSLMQGVVLASQIIQRHSGKFRLFTNRNSIFGFQIQLPLSIRSDQEHLIGSVPHSSSSPKHLTSSSESESLFS